MTHPRIGNMAPAFNLYNQVGKRVALKDYKGKKNVVLYFYPRALTPGCTTQACAVRDHASEFKQLNTVVLGVSPDEVSKLERFTDKKELNFDLLADKDHLLAEKYGVWGPKKFMGKSYVGLIRTTFIIGKDGRLKFILDKFKTKTHHDDVLSLLKEL